jgi:hypothetical protein
MRPGRELDTYIAREALGHIVKVKQKELWEVTDKGERPLRKYSRDITAAWEVVERMGITIIEFLGKGDFMNSGAAVGEDPAETICVAATNALEKKKNSQPLAEC